MVIYLWRGCFVHDALSPSFFKSFNEFEYDVQFAQYDLNNPIHRVDAIRLVDSVLATAEQEFSPFTPLDLEPIHSRSAKEVAITYNSGLSAQKSRLDAMRQHRSTLLDDNLPIRLLKTWWPLDWFTLYWWRCMDPVKIALHQLADLKDQQKRLISVALIASTALLWTPMLIPLIGILTNITPYQKFDQFYAQPLTALILIATGLLITYWTLALANWEWGLVVISLGSCLAELSIFSFSSLNFIGSLLLLIANACCTIAVLITVDRIVSPPHIIKSANVPNLAPRFTVHVYTASLGVAAYCWLLGSAVGGIGGAVNRSIIQWLQSIGWADFTSRVLAVIFALLAGIIGAGFALLPFGLVSKNDRGISENSRNKNLSLLLSALISIGFLVWVYWLGGWAIFQ